MKLLFDFQCIPSQYIENNVQSVRQNKEHFRVSHCKKNNSVRVGVFYMDACALCCNFAICAFMHTLFVVWICFVCRFGFNTTMFGIEVDDL